MSTDELRAALARTVAVALDGTDADYRAFLALAGDLIAGPLADLIRERDELLTAASEVVDDYRMADTVDVHPDKSWCPYTRRGYPGADPQGTCAFGCIDEPSCQTDGPWPLQALEIVVSRFATAPGEVRP